MERKNTHPANRGGFLLRSDSRCVDFVLQWGNRKRLRCMKVQSPHSNSNRSSANGQRVTARVHRRVVRLDLDGIINSKDRSSNKQNNTNGANGSGGSYVYSNLRHLPASPSHRVLRNSGRPVGMRGQSNGVGGLASPDRSGVNRQLYYNTSNRRGGSGSPESAGEMSTSPSDGDTVTPLFLPKFSFTLTHKEVEEDFLAIKGSKLPQRPKKRSKFIQRNVNMVSPGALLSSLTVERYRVREKKVSKKRPGGLKAMGDTDSESEQECCE